MRKNMSNLKQFFKGFKEGWHAFSKNAVVIVNVFLLFFVYIFGVGFTSLIARLCRKKFLILKTEDQTKSYWEDLNLKKRPIEEYYRQF